MYQAVKGDRVAVATRHGVVSGRIVGRLPKSRGLAVSTGWGTVTASESRVTPLSLTSRKGGRVYRRHVPVTYRSVPVVTTHFQAGQVWRHRVTGEYFRIVSVTDHREIRVDKFRKPFSESSVFASELDFVWG